VGIYYLEKFFKSQHKNERSDREDVPGLQSCIFWLTMRRLFEPSFLPEIFVAKGTS
jgi:hypothetical protein